MSSIHYQDEQNLATLQDKNSFFVKYNLFK